MSGPDAESVSIEKQELHTLLAAAFLYLHAFDDAAMSPGVREARQDIEAILAKYGGATEPQRPGEEPTT